MENIAPPPLLSELKAGTQLIAGNGKSTIIADFDFETYSEAGFVWDEQTESYEPLPGARTKGLPVVGAPAYAEHPSTEVICMAYDLKDGKGIRQWQPGEPLPKDFFTHIKNYQLVEAWNCLFEYWIWNKVCVPKYHFPPLPLWLMRDAMAKSRAFAMPGHLAQAGEALKIKNAKMTEGKRLIRKFSVPRNPTKNMPERRKYIQDDAIDGKLMLEYNRRDIEAEAEISSKLPDLIPMELEFWKVDMQINTRGIMVDLPVIWDAIKVIEKAYRKYNARLPELTNGAVTSASEIGRIQAWLTSRGCPMPSLDAETIVKFLAYELPPDVKEVLQIRQTIASAAVKKLYAMTHKVTADDRLLDLFVYHSARTGREAGRGVQPQNLPNSGLDVSKCAVCERHFGVHLQHCPWCGAISTGECLEWNPQAVEDAVTTVRGGSLDLVEMFWGNAVDLVSGCIRGMFISKPGHDLICSDYSAIEAVVLAALAGEEWRMEVFRTHGQIYEMSASKITGVPFEEFAQHKEQNGAHHPLRKKIGKVAELASGYGGWLGAWRAFGADKMMSEDEMKQAIIAWRNASPMIVEFWGGQQRYRQEEYFGLEGMAVAAVMTPGTKFSHRDITYFVQGDILYCKLPSGRCLTYHRPRLAYSERRRGTYELSFEGYNSNPKMGGIGWVRMKTYGGKLTENVVQATARDILTHAIVKLEQHGYPVVLHVHDEIVAEIPENEGSIAEFEQIMSTMPHWAKDYPVKATGGWRGKRYAK